MAQKTRKSSKPQTIAAPAESTPAPAPEAVDVSTASPLTAEGSAALQVQCLRCGKSDFTEKRFASETQYAGLDDDGNPYTHIVRSIVKCKGCGQNKIITEKQNREK